jgi:hypothetical protein
LAEGGKGASNVDGILSWQTVQHAHGSRKQSKAGAECKIVRGCSSKPCQHLVTIKVYKTITNTATVQLQLLYRMKLSFCAATVAAKVEQSLLEWAQQVSWCTACKPPVAAMRLLPKAPEGRKACAVMMTAWLLYATCVTHVNLQCYSECHQGKRRQCTHSCLWWAR